MVEIPFSDEFSLLLLNFVDSLKVTPAFFSIVNGFSDCKLEIILEFINKHRHRQRNE